MSLTAFSTLDKRSCRDWYMTAAAAYAALWDSINPKHPFSKNEWVWRYVLSPAQPVEEKR